MKTLLIPLMTGTLIIAGCATPKNGEWHNTLYQRDYKTSMEKYYRRDFKICLGRALQASSAGLIAPLTIELETEKCLRYGGWSNSTEH